jgi:flagellar basal body P-ring formation protein FlgA
MIRFLLLFAMTFTGVKVTHAEPQWHSHESIYEAVKGYVAQNINTTAEYEINITPLASRLNLQVCTEPLQLFATKLMSAGRSTVNVRCNAGKKWAIFVSVNIVPFDYVVILTQPLQKGEVASEKHFAQVRKDVSTLRGNYLTNANSVVNKQVARTLPSGTIVLSKDFIELKVIKRGDKVVISANVAGIGIKMNGIALTDGTRGQRIQIKNQNSQRVINATVIDAGLVSVSP